MRIKYLFLSVIFFFQIAVSCDLAQLKSQACYLKYTGQSLAALSVFEEIVNIEPNHMMNYWHLGELYRAIGQLQKGWQLSLHRFAKNSAEFAQKKIDLSSVKGKKILIHREGEIGDNIFFIRYAQILKNYGAYIVAQVHPLLVPLLSLCPYLDEVTSEDHQTFICRKSDMLIWQQNLPIAFDTSLQTIPANVPYIFADAQLQEKWKAVLSQDRNFKIGICWQTNPELYLEKMITTKRSMPLKLFKSVMQLPGVSVYSLQKRDGLDQTKELSSDVQLHVFNDLDTEHGAFMDTAALISQLDLIITVDTSIAHLAGAIGAPTWVLLPYVAEWRWMEARKDSPWYPTMRLFRQSEIGNWNDVIENVKKDLVTLTNNRHFL